VTKIQRRKPVKRRPSRPRPIDAELAELALVLDENRLETDVEGWLTLPWRDGWCTAKLAYDMWGDARGARSPIARRLCTIIGMRSMTPGTYAEAEDLRARTLAARALGDETMSLLSACARCIQMLIAGSHGGGHVYNDVLRQAISDASITDVAIPFIEARCWDAIGTHVGLANDHNDVLRRAFKIAWERGLYHAAYSIRRVS